MTDQPDQVFTDFGFEAVDTEREGPLRPTYVEAVAQAIDAVVALAYELGERLAVVEREHAALREAAATVVREAEFYGRDFGDYAERSVSVLRDVLAQGEP